MDKKLNLAIVITLNGDLLDKYNLILEYLNKENINFIRNMQEEAHLTLSTGSIDISKLDTLYQALDNKTSQITPFVLETNGLGVFIKDNINFHIRWHINKELINLKKIIEEQLQNIWEEEKEYNSMFFWLAKTSIAYKDIYLSDLKKIDSFKDLFLCNKMLINEISIIEYENLKGEKVLYKSSFLG